MKVAAVIIWALLFAAPVLAAEAVAPAPVQENGEGVVSLSLESADLRAVVTALARAHGINVVGSDKLTGNVTLHLNKAPVLEALEIILQNAGFVLVKKEGGIYEIVPAAEAVKGDTGKQVPRVEIFPLKYADVEEVAKLLVPNAVPDVKAIAKDAASNQLIISGTDDQLKKVQQIIEAVDRALPQVAIQARIVEIYADRARSLGVSLDFDFREEKPNQKGTIGFDLTQNPVEVATFSFAYLTRRIDASLTALVQKEVAEVLSAPQVTTGHGRRAEIKVVNQIPVITRTTRVVDQVTITDETVTFKETGLTLTVTPRVLADGKIEMQVEPSVLQLTGWTDTNPPAPIVDTRSAKTAVTISDGRWLVIGGLMRYNERSNERGIPLLKDVPWIGWLFRTTYTTREKSDLIILVSATVLDDAKAEQQVSDTESKMREHRKEGPLEGGPFPAPEKKPGGAQEKK